MLSVDDGGRIISQAQAVVDSPETVAVYSVFWAVVLGVAFGFMAWACYRCYMGRVVDLRTMLPALHENTTALNEIARTSEHQTLLIQELLRRGE